MLTERSPRAVLLDLGLPGIDGMEVCRRIRASSDIPVIMLTARDDEIDKVVGLEIGADDYVTKPFSPAGAGGQGQGGPATFRAATGGAGRHHSRPISKSTMAGGRCCTPTGEVVQPTAREFDLLWHLARNRGIVLSRGQLLEAVWGYDYFGETRTVDVHVRQLRKKLPDIPIETVWGVGYKMDR